jgi:hypothetical protein
MRMDKPLMRVTVTVPSFDSHLPWCLLSSVTRRRVSFVVASKLFEGAPQ